MEPNTMIDFKSPSEFDFLMNVGNSAETPHNLARDSLFVKFDPLVGAQTLPTGPRKLSTIISPNKSKEVSLSPSTEPSILDISNTSSAQNKSNSSSYRSALNMTDLQNKSASIGITPITPPKNPALEAIDRLISLTPSPKVALLPEPEPEPEPEPIKEEPYKEDTEKMQYIEELKVLRELMTKQEEEFNRQVQDLRHQVEVAENKEQTLIKRVADKTKLEQQMNVVMQEYEKNIAKLIADKEHDKKVHESNCAEIISQRDETSQHLASVENAFSDVHKKYERCKTVIEEFKTNEDSLKKCIIQLEETVQAQEKRYEALKSHALVQLEKANVDLDATKRQHQSEQTKLTAMLKKAELKIKSLQESLAQKSTESEELAAICDELINKVGDK